MFGENDSEEIWVYRHRQDREITISSANAVVSKNAYTYTLIGILVGQPLEALVCVNHAHSPRLVVKSRILMSRTGITNKVRHVTIGTLRRNCYNLTN
jgi:hypothetical protein